MILVIDNYDSFVYNLARHMELAGWKYKVARNNKITIQEIEQMRPDAIVVSPGPCSPKEAGISVEAIRRFGAEVPVLGVCLGHQCIGEAYGAQVIRAAVPVHGKSGLISHNRQDVFEGLPTPLKVGRYHSLAVTLAPDGPLESTATNVLGEVMAVRHKTHPVYGVQFHPESVLTDHGMDMIRNFTAMALAWNSRKIAA